MKTEFSASWVSSTQPRKQRKYRYNAPLHIKSNFLSVNLSKDLRKKYGMRNIRVRKGDKVKVMRGNNKKHVGKVDSVDMIHVKVFVEGVEQVRKDGSKSFKQIDPSNLQIIELDTSDKLRFKHQKKESKPEIKAQKKK
jgi:large subunit ribosomal protein L24